MTPELPSREKVSEESEWDETVDTQQRIKEVVLTQGQDKGLSAKEVAERARCSQSTARKYLRQMTGEYVVEVNQGSSKEYYPNPEFLRWKRTFELASENTVDGLREELEETREEIEDLKSEYGVSSPDEMRVSDLESPSHEDVERVIRDRARWRSNEEYAGILKDALDMSDRLDRTKPPAGR